MVKPSISFMANWAIAAEEMPVLYDICLRLATLLSKGGRRATFYAEAFELGPQDEEAVSPDADYWTEPKEGQMLVPVSRVLTRLRINLGKQRPAGWVGDTLLRWMQRCTRRVDTHLHIPSFVMAYCYDPVTQTPFVYGTADTVPSAAPAWLENVKA